MFSGIVQSHNRIATLTRTQDFMNFSVELQENQLEGLELGASVAIDGVCMTVVKITGNQVFFDAMKQTLDITSLGSLALNDQVNIERSVKYGDEIGGHLVSGHIHAQAEIVDIDRSVENNCVFTFKAPETLAKYFFPKGFIAINGASLTLVAVEKNRFSVSFIPETLRKTTFSLKKTGDRVNIEIDQQTQAIVNTVENYLNRVS